MTVSGRLYRITTFWIRLSPLTYCAFYHLPAMPVTSRVGKSRQSRHTGTLVRVVVDVSPDPSASRAQVNRVQKRLREVLMAEYGPQYAVVVRQV